MTKRRLAPRSYEPPAKSLFYSLIVGLCFSSAAQAAPIAAGQASQATLTVIPLTLLSAATLVLWGCHRRDYASPRRNGRRI
jgi:hypothetical protein